MSVSAQGTEPGVAGLKVYEALRVPIVDGQIPPGERINIDAVARRLEVSQTPVRDALQKLEGDDLVVYTPGRGYRTTPILDSSGLRSLFEFRLLVEPWAAGAVATDRLTNPAAALAEELTRFEESARAPGDVRQGLLAHDSRFHGILLAATGNKVLQSAYAQTHCHLHVFRLYAVDISGAITVQEHKLIIDAIRSCEPGVASQAMTDHIRNAYRRAAVAFGRSQPDLRIGGSPPESR